MTRLPDLTPKQVQRLVEANRRAAAMFPSSLLISRAAARAEEIEAAHRKQMRTGIRRLVAAFRHLNV